MRRGLPLQPLRLDRRVGRSEPSHRTSASSPMCFRSRLSRRGLSLTLGFRLSGEPEFAQARGFRNRGDPLAFALLDQLRVALLGREPVLLRFPSTVRFGARWLGVPLWHRCLRTRERSTQSPSRRSCSKSPRRESWSRLLTAAPTGRWSRKRPTGWQRINQQSWNSGGYDGRRSIHVEAVTPRATNGQTTRGA